MPAIASLEDLKAAQKELLEAQDIDRLEKSFQKVSADRLEKYLQAVAGREKPGAVEG